MSSDWPNYKPGDWRDSIPYGEKIKEHILTYPQWAIYVRRDERFKCPLHYSEEAESFESFGQVDCFCWGLGVKLSTSLIPTKLSLGTGEINPKKVEIKHALGFLDFWNDVVYTPREVSPQINDIIIYCEWNTSSQYVNRWPPIARPIRLSSIYVIKQINSHFQREISFCECGVEGYNIQNDMMNRLLPEKLTNLKVFDVNFDIPTYWSE